MNEKPRQLVASVTFAALLFGPASALAAVAPTLGNAQSFAVLGASAVSNTNATVITGDLGIAPGLASSVTGFPPGIVIGTIFAGAASPDPTAAAAQLDASAAFTAIDQPCDTTYPGGQNLGGLTLPPGVYCSMSSFLLTGTLTLDAGGNPNAVWIFKMPASTLTTATDSVVRVINGGQACNVFWRVGSSATLNTRTTFIGTIIADQSISLVGGGASIFGRALALNAAVTLDNNTISATACGMVTPGTPTLGKSFSPAVINGNGVSTSTLTITLSNSSLSAATLTAPLTDTLPAGVTIAATPNASTTCIGGAFTPLPSSGDTAVTLSAGAIPAGSACTVKVDVIAAAGSYINTLPVGALQTNQGSNAVPAVSTLTVNSSVPPGGPPTLGKEFSPATINTGGVSTLTITLSNPNPVVAMLSAPLTDNLPPGLVVANPTNASTNCGGGTMVSATAGGTAVTLPTGSTIPFAIGPTAGTCTVTVKVTAVTAGSFFNTLAVSALQTNNGSNAAPVVTTLTVTPHPPAVAPTPTLSWWALILVTALLALVAFAAMRRQAM